MQRTTLITGAGGGIGAAIATELASRGDHVVVNYRADQAAASRVVAGIEAAGGSAVAVAADVTDPAEVDGLVRQVLADRGGIDAVVVNANAAPPPFAPLAELDWSAFADKLLGELGAAFHLTKRVLDPLRDSKGSLVFIGSTAADYVGGGRLAHGTAKAALATFARHVAAETARDGVSVLTIAPGAVRSASTEAMLDEQTAATLARNSVLGRMLEPGDVAAAVALALDPAARTATGSVLRVDAGWSVLHGGASA